jgi:hypothetical protein
MRGDAKKSILTSAVGEESTYQTKKSSVLSPRLFG